MGRKGRYTKKQAPRRKWKVAFRDLLWNRKGSEGVGQGNEWSTKHYWKKYLLFHVLVLYMYTCSVVCVCVCVCVSVCVSVCVCGVSV